MRLGIPPLISGLAAGALVLGALTACSPVDTTKSADSPKASTQATAETGASGTQAAPSPQGQQSADESSTVQQPGGSPAVRVSEATGATPALKEAPSSLPVSCTLMVLHSEGAEQVTAEAREAVAADPTADAPASDLSAFDGGVLLATGDDQLIP